MTGIYLQGFGVSAGLIVAIGAQNAFLLSQSVRRNRPLLIAAICAMSDLLLIFLGLAGVGSAVAANALLARWAARGGAAFLVVYGFGALRSAWRGTALETSEQGPPTRRALVASTLAVTFLNPHAYLDTLVLIGSIGGQYPAAGRWLFGFGAVSASCVWFFTLALGGPFLAPIFRRPVAWRILDVTICLVMWGIAFSLLHPALPA